MLHILSLTLFKNYNFLSPIAKDQAPQALTTRTLSEKEFQRILENPIVETAKAPNLPTKDLKIPARFRGEQTQRVEKEMKSTKFGSALGGGREKGGEAKPVEASPSKTLEKLGYSKTLSESLASSLKSLKENTNGSEGIEMPLGTHDALPDDLSLGSRTLLNTDEYRYASFYNRVKQEIAPRWESLVRNTMESMSAGGREGQFTTRLVFYLDNTGRVVRIGVEKSSGETSLDLHAKDAVKEAGRFPNPPKELKDSQGLHPIRLGFMVSIQRRLNVDNRAKERLNR